MVRHVLADGTELAEIAGHIVKVADAENVYAIMEGIKHEEGTEAGN